MPHKALVATIGIIICYLCQGVVSDRYLYDGFHRYLQHGFISRPPRHNTCILIKLYPLYYIANIPSVL